jgi:hypothetical protein
MDETKALWGQYNAASEALKKGALGSCSEPLGMRRAREQNYRLAYQALVRADEVPQIRGKYRGA